jgi:hypothetical protein
MGAPTDRCAHVYPNGARCAVTRHGHGRFAPLPDFAHAFVDPAEAAPVFNAEEDARIADLPPEAAPDEAAVREIVDRNGGVYSETSSMSKAVREGIAAGRKAAFREAEAIVSGGPGSDGVENLGDAAFAIARRANEGKGT